jgi:glycerophosphoryl diester phosphodiesterase
MSQQYFAIITLAQSRIMRISSLLFALFLSACGSSSLLSDLPSPDTLPELKTDQVIIAHRGASGHAPEHTFAAYDLALQMGAEYIEQDISPTADGVLVCLHDTTLERTARGPAENCTGAVTDKTLAQLRTCDFGSWFNEAFPDRARPEYVGQPIPTLEEVFQRYGTSANYYIETKTSAGESDSVERKLYELIREYGLYDGMVQRRQVLVQSFQPNSLLAMQQIDPAVPLIQLTPAATLLLLPIAATYAIGVGPPATDVTPALVEQAHSLRLAMHPYTINETEDLEAMAALCVDGLFTNFPDRYRAVLAATDYGCPPPRR